MGTEITHSNSYQEPVNRVADWKGAFAACEVERAQREAEREQWRADWKVVEEFVEAADRWHELYPAAAEGRLTIPRHVIDRAVAARAALEPVLARVRGE